MCCFWVGRQVLPIRQTIVILRKKTRFWNDFEIKTYHCPKLKSKHAIIFVNIIWRSRQRAVGPNQRLWNGFAWGWRFAIQGLVQGSITGEKFIISIILFRLSISSIRVLILSGVGIRLSCISRTIIFVQMIPHLWVCSCSRCLHRNFQSESPGRKVILKNHSFDKTALDSIQLFVYSFIGLHRRWY